MYKHTNKKIVICNKNHKAKESNYEMARDIIEKEKSKNNFFLKKRKLAHSKRKQTNHKPDNKQDRSPSINESDPCDNETK